MMLRRLDHIAIAVRDTEEALTFYRDRLGLPVLFSEVMEEQGARLTHLDMGGVHLQLVEPLREDHPLSVHLDEKGEGLHHLCFLVDDVSSSIRELPAQGLPSRDPAPRRGPNGRKAAFLDPASTRGVLLEITSEPEKP
jgi:methylmalonyl-CoA/ethylmalonyl-CoA epimerase